MIPHKTTRGKDALRRLKVYEGIPPPYDRRKRIVVPGAMRVMCLKPGRKVYIFLDFFPIVTIFYKVHMMFMVICDWFFGNNQNWCKFLLILEREEISYWLNFPVSNVILFISVLSCWPLVPRSRLEIQVCCAHSWEQEASQVHHRSQKERQSQGKNLDSYFHWIYTKNECWWTMCFAETDQTSRREDRQECCTLHKDHQWLWIQLKTCLRQNKLYETYKVYFYWTKIPVAY